MRNLISLTINYKDAQDNQVGYQTYGFTYFQPSRGSHNVSSATRAYINKLQALLDVCRKEVSKAGGKSLTTITISLGTEHVMATINYRKEIDNNLIISI